MIFRTPARTAFSFSLALIFLIQPVYAARTALLEFPDYRLRGQMWDLRDAQIRAAAEGVGNGDPALAIRGRAPAPVKTGPPVPKAEETV